MAHGDRDFYQDYNFLQPLAVGGMGTVYLAEAKSTHTQCVIKQMRSGNSDEDEDIAEARRLFKREVDILRSLDHAHIVKFLDDHIDGERYFLVMDFVAGNNLETTLGTFGKFNQDDALKVGIQICEVLEYLHNLKPDPIIYRDLKPSNLMLTPEGNIVFIDFGIARTLMPVGTATRVVTAGYSPPEQYFGKPEARSDLYALGATLAHLVTGVRPRPLITCFPSQQNADVLPSFDKLIGQLTAHSPHERPTSARAVRYEMYRIYSELHPDFQLPDGVFGASEQDAEDQFISQKIMQSGLTAASSAADRLPPKRGPELESYTDEEMPSQIMRIIENLKTTSQKLSKIDTSDRLNAEAAKREQSVATKGELSTSRNLRNSIQKKIEKQSIWARFMSWIRR